MERCPRDYRTREELPSRDDWRLESSFLAVGELDVEGFVCENSCMGQRAVYGRMHQEQLNDRAHQRRLPGGGVE